ncbi:MAG TPA: DUF4870 domain-containing protein [Steroidobacteraceae bacterium]|nr:DUF4870 domain-containing protein [Steroidobacteraceae bacterium]
MSESGEPASYGGAVSKDERNLAMFAHLSAFAGLIFPAGGNVIAPLIVWLTQREKSAFVADQSLEALNFNITVLIAEVVCGVLFVVGIGIPLGILLGIAWLIGTILGAVKASEGQRFRHRFTLRLVH